MPRRLAASAAPIHSVNAYCQRLPQRWNFDAVGLRTSYRNGGALMLREQHQSSNVVPGGRPGNSNGGPTLLLPRRFATFVQMKPPGPPLRSSTDRPDPTPTLIIINIDKLNSSTGIINSRSVHEPEVARCRQFTFWM